MNKGFIAGTTLSLALIAAACGSGGSEASDPATTSGPPTEMAMDMGDVSLTRADVVADAELVNGPFHLLDTAPVGFDAVDGAAWLARHTGGTSVTIELEGLPPNSEFMAHVHAGHCSDAGGPHYQFDPDGGTMPPNEIHLLFASNADGFGLMTAENPRVADAKAHSVVVHQVSATATKVACAELG